MSNNQTRKCHVLDMTNPERVSIIGDANWKQSVLLEYDEWDRQMERDFKLGKFDQLIEQAKREYENGNSIPMSQFLNTK